MKVFSKVRQFWIKLPSKNYPPLLDFSKSVTFKPETEEDSKILEQIVKLFEDGTQSCLLSSLDINEICNEKIQNT